MTKLTGRPEKRFYTQPEENHYLIEKVTYDIWGDLIVVSSYFLDEEVFQQLNYLKTDPFFNTQVQE